MTRLAIASSLVAAAVACSPHKPTRNPAPPIAVPDSFAEQTDASAPMPEKWWVAFGDSQLDALVDSALSGNFQLAGAWARVGQSRAIARQASSGKWPQVNAQLGARRATDRFFFGPEPIEVDAQNNFNASIGASYELDLWKKVGSRAAGAALDAKATRDDMEAIAISIAAEVTEAWFDVLAQRETRALLEAQLATNKTSVELVTLRFQQGLGASAVDVFQARQQVIATEAQLALVESREKVSAYRLAVLVGRAPGAIELGGADKLPALPALPGTGVPADLLLRRPDVRAIRRRVEAADWRVAAAVADRLPSISLSGDVSTKGLTVGDLFASPLYSLTAGLLGPIFDGGRRKAEVARNRAVVAELMAAYGQTVLGALLEINNAIALEKGQLEHIAQLEQQIEVSEATLRETRNRYREGITDYLPVLTAQQTLQRAEQNLLVARRQLLSYRIQLCRALGGTWTRDLERTGTKKS